MPSRFLLEVSELAHRIHMEVDVLRFLRQCFPPRGGAQDVAGDMLVQKTVSSFLQARPGGVSLV